MSFHGFDPGDRNNWYQSPHLGPFTASPAAYGVGISGGYYSSPYHSYGSSTCEFTQFSSQPNPYPQLQLNPSATIINGHLLPHQFPCVPQTHSQFFPPPYLQPIHPSIPTIQSPPVPTFLPQTQFLNPFPSFGVGSSNAPTTTAAASTPSLGSTPSQPRFGSTPSQSEFGSSSSSQPSGANSSPFGPTVSVAISGPTSSHLFGLASSSSPPPISDFLEHNEVLHPRPAVSAMVDELEELRQPLSVALTEEVNLASPVLDENFTNIQLLQELTDEDTVDENDEPAPILVDALVDNNEPDGSIYRQSPPQIGGTYWMSLRSVAIPASGIKAPLECHPLSIVRIDECLSSLDFVLIVEKNFVLIVEKNENFSSRSPAMNSVNCLETIKDAGALFLKMPERTIVSWKTLISALVLNGQEEKVLGVYDTMISEGRVPTHFSLATLFGACEGWLDVEKGIELNVILYNTLLLLCADIGYTDQAIKIFEDVKSSETWKPDSWTFSSMMTIYSCSGKVSEAKRTLNEMREAGFQLNILILISLIQCYGKAKRTDDVVEAFNQLQQLGITPDERFCGYLLNVMTQTPRDALCKLTDCIERGNEKLGYVVRPLVEKQDSSQNFRKEASELFNSVGSDMKAYCNCFISLRVNLQLLKRACEFLNLGLTLEIYTDIQSKYPTQWSLYLKGLSVGAVFTALHVWINDLSHSLESGEEPPTLFGINTENGQTKAISQTRSFSIEVIDFLKVNSVFSSSRYTYGPVVSMITVASQSVVHLIFHAWLLLIHAHKHNSGKRIALVTLPYFALGAASHVLESLSVIFVNVSTHKKAAVDVICHAAIFYVEFVFFLHMQMVEKLMPSPIVDFPGHSMTRKEIVTFWIWLPTTLLHLQVWVLNLHGLIGIKAKMLIGDAFLIREPMFDNVCHIIATGAIVIRHVCHSGGDLHMTNSYSHMDHYNICWLQTKVILLESTYTGAYFQVIFDYGLTFVLGNVNDDLHLVYSTICCLLLFNFDIPHVVVSRYWRLDYISECNLMIMDNEITQSIFTMIFKVTAKKSDSQQVMLLRFSLSALIVLFFFLCSFTAILAHNNEDPTIKTMEDFSDCPIHKSHSHLSSLSVDSQSLKKQIDESSSFSDAPAPAPAQSMTRVLYTEKNVLAHRFIQNLVGLSGLSVEEDAVGNVFGLWEGSNPELSAIVTGSYIDAIPYYGILQVSTSNLLQSHGDNSHLEIPEARALYVCNRKCIGPSCESYEGYEAKVADVMIKAVTESGMVSAEELWAHFPCLTCLRHEDMPYFKGGGMLGLLFYNYILSWANVLSYLSGLCFQLGLYLYIADWTRVGSSGKLVCLGMFADRAI